jgi:ATP-binding protein involved in chromosome partitioning
MFRKVEVPVLGIVENMSYFLCPHCGERSEIFGHGGAHEEADRLGVAFLGEIPLHIAIRTTSDCGNPITVSDPDSSQAGAFHALAEKVWTAVETELDRSEAATPRIVFD